MNNSGWILLGSVIGFSVVLGMIIINNANLKKEAERQVGTVMKTTGKIVSHYKNASNLISRDDEEEIDAQDEKWDEIESNVAARVNA